MSGSIWLVLCGMGALLVRLGFALNAIGHSRAKNSAGIAMRSLAEMAAATLAFWVIGAAILIPMPDNPEPLINTSLICGSAGFEQSSKSFFALVMVVLASGIVPGAIAERSRFYVNCLVAAGIGGIIVPLVGRWVCGYTEAPSWHRWIYFKDFGASMVHLTGGTCAITAAWMLGPRNGKFNRDGSSNAIPGHNLPLALLGSLLMIVGWLPASLGFVVMPGGANVIGQVAGNLVLAGAAGSFTSMLLGYWRYGKPDIHFTFSGLLGGLVSATATADLSSSWKVVVAAVAAGLIVPYAMMILDLRFRVDDTTGSAAGHVVGALCGLLGRALLDTSKDFSKLLFEVTLQAVGAFGIILLCVAVMLALLLPAKMILGIRSRQADEFDGLDLAEHDIGAYPDFQQTMIKSYHLREV
jgi:ammonium transporter, Amt family